MKKYFRFDINQTKTVNGIKDKGKKNILSGIYVTLIKI